MNIPTSGTRASVPARWWRGLLGCAFVLLVLASGSPVLAAASSTECEQFDLSGLPEKPTTFLEQQIHSLVAHHRPGDVSEGAFIQTKLARAYREKGDTERARTAERRAGSVAGAGGSPPAVAATGPAVLPPSAPVPPERTAAFHGSYFGMVGSVLHTWDFSNGGSFLHTIIASGAGTSVRNSERGRFRLEGDTLVLMVESTAGGFVTPAIGGHSSQIGASKDTSGETRRLALRKIGPGTAGGIELAGSRLKPKTW